MLALEMDGLEFDSRYPAACRWLVMSLASDGWLGLRLARYVCDEAD